jgi:hypothetical protein
MKEAMLATGTPPLLLRPLLLLTSMVLRLRSWRSCCESSFSAPASDASTSCSTRALLAAGSMSRGRAVGTSSEMWGMLEASTRPVR